MVRRDFRASENSEAGDILAGVDSVAVDPRTAAWRSWSAAASAAAVRSTHEIDAHHEAFKGECWDENLVLDTLVDLEAE